MSTWELSPHIVLQNDRIPADDGARQLATAAEICRRLDDQPGVILADDVGMGKTFVALAVAASVVQGSRNRQVVIMVPSAVGDKWPKDWSVFREKCLQGGPDIRATEKTVSSGSEFLKLLDDPPAQRKHIIFVTHWALSSNLQDPFVRLAIIREAFKYQRSMSEERKAFPRWASKVLGNSRFTQDRVESLMGALPRDWKAAWQRVSSIELDDDPVPEAVLEALAHVDLEGVREVLRQLPRRATPNVDARLTALRRALSDALNEVWKDALTRVRARLPLIILDEAHHLKNPNTLRSLFDTGDDASADSIRGALGGVFDRMLLLTATPFQLGHRELIAVLRLFGSTRMTRDESVRFEAQMVELLKHLDAAQAASLRLERAWERVTADDLAALPAGWWRDEHVDAPEHVAGVAGFAREAIARLDVSSEALRPWVVRHSKPRLRSYLPGAATLPERSAAGGGLTIGDRSVLPFLLAARAQSYVALKGQADNSRARALFADGLASSFEAYLATRSSAADVVDDVEAAASTAVSTTDVDWYLDRIAAALPAKDAAARAGHPKVHATVQRALAHWRDGEKVLIFCFYRATGRALREHLSAALGAEIAQLASSKFGIESDSLPDLFDQLGTRADALLRSDRPGGRLVKERAEAIAAAAGLDAVDQEAFGNVTLRFLRTPSFLTRYVDLNERSGEQAIERTFAIADGSGVTLEAKLAGFAGRVAGLTAEERTSLWSGLITFRTGARQVDSLDVEEDAELTPEGVTLLPNVHLANGETDQAQRRRLMTTFNTPFLPEILVASSVMAEGVDLHRECRHVVHHDLDWNPSTLEQRTGRVDRLGSKSSLTRQPILVCEPYVAGTQDEKQYKVVKDRERWFGVLMGGRVPEDEFSTDKIADRVPLPEPLLEDLTIDLSVWQGWPD